MKRFITGKEASPMRIEAYTQVQQLYNTNKPAKVSGRTHASATDKIQISSFGKDIQTAKNAVAAGRMSGKTWWRRSGQPLRMEPIR